MSNIQGILNSSRNRGIIAWWWFLVLISFYIILYFNKEIDSFIINQKFETIKKEIVLNSIISDENQLQTIKKNILASIKKPNFYHPNLHISYHRYVDELQNTLTTRKILKAMYTPLNPLSKLLRKKPATEWFLYSFLYTVLVVGMGIVFIRKWRHDKYQRMRTVSVMFFQLVIAFLLPSFLEAMNQKAFYFSYFWPLKIEYLFPSTLKGFPKAMALWAIFMSFIAVPVLTYFFGKRWYCSWICGCGALANTMGDSWRHLSSKSSFSWKIEKISVYFVLVLTIVATVIIVLKDFGFVNDTFRTLANKLSKWYWLFISAGFAGVVGTGFYPIAGTRVWCRFGCPQAAILGILQKFFSRFRITTNGDQCMSCGNCTTYCEMGIDVRSYAMQGKDIVRASCVGCGICMSVCPRGVLKLETSSMKVNV